MEIAQSQSLETHHLGSREKHKGLADPEILKEKMGAGSIGESGQIP